ncbi:MAG: ribulose-phosphate 3-epimerase [Planctomycetota bacterium]
MSRLETIEKLTRERPAILPSMLLCDFANLQTEIDQLDAAQFPALHLDVMDGVFVPNITYGMTIVRAARKCTSTPLDVHLMIVEPAKYLTEFKEAGADVITIHAEATNKLSDCLKQIQDLDMLAGVAINPGTPVSSIENELQYADLVLAMSVEPGFGGQKFDETVLTKFPQIRQIVGDDVFLQIDGGVNENTIESIHQAGVDLMVAGSAIFKTDDYKATRQHLRGKFGEINERT